MHCLSVMDVASLQMRCSTARILNAGISSIFRKKSSVSPISIPESNLSQPPPRSACTGDCARRTLLPSAAPQQYNIITGEPPFPPKDHWFCQYLHRKTFFSLMKSRLKEEQESLPLSCRLNQLKVEESKAILRAFHNAFPNALVWASADQQWIMIGDGRKGTRR